MHNNTPEGSSTASALVCVDKRTIIPLIARAAGQLWYQRQVQGDGIRTAQPGK